MYKIERPHLNKDSAENVADRLTGNQINKVINFSHKSVSGINGSASATPQDQEQMRPVGSDVIEAFFPTPRQDRGSKDFQRDKASRGS